MRHQTYSSSGVYLKIKLPGSADEKEKWTFKSYFLRIVATGGLHFIKMETICRCKIAMMKLSAKTKNYWRGGRLGHAQAAEALRCFVIPAKDQFSHSWRVCLIRFNEIFVTAVTRVNSVAALESSCVWNAVSQTKPAPSGKRTLAQAQPFLPSLSSCWRRSSDKESNLGWSSVSSLTVSSIPIRATRSFMYCNMHSQPFATARTNFFSFPFLNLSARRPRATHSTPETLQERTLSSSKVRLWSSEVKRSASLLANQQLSNRFA